MEGFPSPDAKTMMEAMEKGESEKILADLSEDERQDREIALDTTQSVVKGNTLINSDKVLQELVGDVQLAVEEEPSEALHANDEMSPGLMTSLMARLRPFCQRRVYVSRTRRARCGPQKRV